MNRILACIGTAAFCLMAWTPATQARVSIMPYPIIHPPIAPAPPVGYVYQWVEPVYRTIIARVWIGETTRQIESWIEISPGVWQRCWRTEIVPGHYEDQTRRELLSAGYWQLVWIGGYPQPRPIDPPHDEARSVGVDGYSHANTEDLSKFSGLSEWPAK